MREWYMSKYDISYECPYCHVEIEDCTGDEIETRIECCGHCGEEFKLVVIDED